MNLQQFEALCARARIKPIAARTTPHGKILLGERFQPRVAGYDKPHWETFWAIERDECTWMQFVRNDAYAVKNGLFRVVTQDERVADALEVADMWVRAQGRVAAHA